MRFEMKRVVLILFAALLACGAANAQFTPPPAAAFISPSSGVWDPLTDAASFGMLSYAPPAVGLYCQATEGGPWAPCDLSSGGGAVSSVFGRAGDVVAEAGDYSAYYLGLGGGTITAPYAKLTLSDNGGTASTLELTGNAGEGDWKLTSSACGGQFNIYSGGTAILTALDGGAPPCNTPAANNYIKIGTLIAAGPITTPATIPGTLYSAAGTTLPTCAVGIQGEQAVVSDATTPTYMGAYTPGGDITAAVICSYNSTTTTYSWLTH